MKKVNKTIQWLIFTAVFSWGLFSFLLLAGEDNPYEPLPISTFILVKIGSMLSIALCIWVGKKLTRAGYMPKLPED